MLAHVFLERSLNQNISFGLNVDFLIFTLFLLWQCGFSTSVPFVCGIADFFACEVPERVLSLTQICQTHYINIAQKLLINVLCGALRHQCLTQTWHWHIHH